MQLASNLLAAVAATNLQRNLLALFCLFCCCFQSRCSFPSRSYGYSCLEPFIYSDIHSFQSRWHREFSFVWMLLVTQTFVLCTYMSRAMVWHATFYFPHKKVYKYIRTCNFMLFYLTTLCTHAFIANVVCSFWLQ